MRAHFIAGSGTDVGKTYVTASLVRGLRAQGSRVRVCKPLASGLPSPADPAFASTDPALLLAAQGLPVTARTLDACSPWRFSAALSPDMAAAREGRSVRFEDVVGWSRAVLAEPDFDHVLVEGVGGVMSPITADATGLDLAAALGLPVLLVCGSYLGSISHGLTALRALSAAGLTIASLLVNETADSPVPLDEVVAAFARLAPDAPVSRLAWNTQASTALLSE